MSQLDVYRASLPPERDGPPPRELLVELADRDRDRGAAVLWFQLFSLPVLVGVIVASAANPTLGLVAMVVAGALAIGLRRRAAKARVLRLTVADGALTIPGKGAVRLDALEDVVLDVKTIRRVQDGDSAVPAVRFTDTRVGPEVDLARIVIVGDGERVYLAEHWLAHMDATEWLGKLRVFLRKHGWVPADERVTDSDESEDPRPEE